ncbi:MAG TPA: phosphatase PAP2 family protein [Bradyrhizobium sp.]|nr:phosphatase PAP2 family protein [Bradyrhizobium sp.]
MSAQNGAGESPNYLVRVFGLVSMSMTQLVRPASHARRAEAARRLARHALPMIVVVGVMIVALMVGFDAREIALMPPRGAAGLWPARVLTDLGKDSYVLSVLAAMLLVVTLVAAGRRGTSRARLQGIGLRFQFLFCAVLVPLLPGEMLKWMVGRGRPFVGGEANPFNFAPFAGTEAYFSFPSAHAVTAFALAFAVSAVWPRMRGVMIAYALVIAFTRLVLLAHHPSDVAAGALIGVVGAMFVRYWFAVRGLEFAIGRDGAFTPMAQARVKRVAHGASEP